MMDEPELNELLQKLNYEYDEVTIEILGKCADKDDYTDEFISQNNLYAQIDLLHYILNSKSKAALAEKAEHN